MGKYVVTGATGFIGRHLVHELLKREGEIHVLIRPASRGRLDAMIAATPGGAGRIHGLEGDITRDGCGLGADARDVLAGAEVYHLAAVYDLEADDEANRLANVEGTRNVVSVVNIAGAARLHHVSSIAVVRRS